MISLLGTMIGASIGVVIKNPSNKMLSGITGFAGGLMLSVVVFDLIPESIREWSFPFTVIFCILGMVLFIAIDYGFHFDNMGGHLKVAAMASIALMLHNFPEGVIMGCGFAGGGTLGLKMALVIAIHDIPEGVAVSAPLMASRVKVKKILMYAFFTAVPTAFGAFAGAYVGGISKNVLGICLSLASGIMLYVVCGEMIPESNKLWDGIVSTIGILSGIIMGLVIIQIL